MTEFERLAEELNIPLTTDEYGLYTGHARALANIATDVIMSGTSETNILEEIKNRFYSKFPYMKK